VKQMKISNQMGSLVIKSNLPLLTDNKKRNLLFLSPGWCRQQVPLKYL